VADIFTALTEDRPYRKGMDGAEALRILTEASERHRVDSDLVVILHDHLDELNQKRQAAQQSALEEYQQFVETANRLTHRD
jgi:HD-GYP domain-containing protein (c-di-GMP phosphodiesterase class II)